MLARRAGVDGHDGVLMIGGADHHRVQILALEQLAVIEIGGRIRQLLFCPGQLLLVDVANGGDVGQAFLLQDHVVAQQAAGPAADADMADDDPLVGAKGARRNVHRRGDGCTGRGQKLSAIQLAHGVDPLSYSNNPGSDKHYDAVL